MFQKRSAPYDQGLPQEQRLRANIADLFLTNALPAQRIQQMFNDSHAAGARNFGDLKRAADDGGKNDSRNIRRKLLKRTPWPPLYYSPVRLWDPKAQREVVQHLPFLLPHEMLYTLALHNSPQALLQQTAMSNGTKARLLEAQASLGVQGLVGLGLWGDGVPANWDRTESYEVVSMMLPGIANFRVPITSVSKKFWITRTTSDDIMETIKWSLECALTGQFPQQRHDQTPWSPSDSWRKKRQGQSLGARGVLCEVRADWSWLASTLRLPAWNAKAGNCFICKCTREEAKDVSLSASWRQRPLSHWELLQKWAETGVGVCPLWQAPGVSLKIVTLDWLHIADLGVASVFQGNLWYYILNKIAPGESRKSQCSKLFLQLQEFYRANADVTSRYDTLVPTMLKQPKSQPRLRGKGAEIRGVVAFSYALACKYLEDSDPKEHTMKQAARLLLEVYNNLSHDRFNADNMKTQGRQFMALCAALEKASAGTLYWQLKPKHHLFLHLCESGSNPVDTWTYRDEDFGGAMAALARRRGGKNSPRASAERMLRLFCGKHEVPLF